MQLTEKCYICNVAQLSVHSSRQGGYDLLGAYFLKQSKELGWHSIETEAGTKFICPFCNKRVEVALERGLVQKDNIVIGENDNIKYVEFNKC